MFGDITFNNDNLANYEAYIKEVKPYSTNIREFIMFYERITKQMMKDFSLISDLTIFLYKNLFNYIFLIHSDCGTAGQGPN